MATTRIESETILPLALVRQHTKTEDIETVTDQQLELYRAVAMELAERYSDASLNIGNEVIEQYVGYPAGRDIVVPLDYPATHGIVTVMADGVNYIQLVSPGAKAIRIGPGTLDITGKPIYANACSTSIDSGVALRYTTNSGCDANGVPAGVRLGMLQFIAWAIAHPGDCAATAEAARACGALATWKMYRAEIGF